MFRSTRAGFVGVVVASLLVGGACATLDMPTPVKKVRTENMKAPSYEYYPPPLQDAAVMDAAVMDAAVMDAAVMDAAAPSNQRGRAGSSGYGSLEE